MLTGKVKIQAEILNRWRYAAITGGCWITQETRDTEFDGNELCDCSLFCFNIHIQVLPLPDSFSNVVGNW